MKCFMQCPPSVLPITFCSHLPCNKSERHNMKSKDRFSFVRKSCCQDAIVVISTNWVIVTPRPKVWKQQSVNSALTPCQTCLPPTRARMFSVVTWCGPRKWQVCSTWQPLRRDLPSQLIFTHGHMFQRSVPKFLGRLEPAPGQPGASRPGASDPGRPDNST